MLAVGLGLSSLVLNVKTFPPLQGKSSGIRLLRLNFSTSFLVLSTMVFCYIKLMEFNYNTDLKICEYLHPDSQIRTGFTSYHLKKQLSQIINRPYVIIFHMSLISLWAI